MTHDTPFPDLPLDSRVNVVYERMVSVHSMDESVGFGFQVQDRDHQLANISAALSDWYCVVDCEGEVVCVVPPGGTVGTDNDAVSRASVVAAMLNQDAPGWPREEWTPNPHPLTVELSFADTLGGTPEARGVAKAIASALGWSDAAEFTTEELLEHLKDLVHTDRLWNESGMVDPISPSVVIR
jgi:hypothetical protein